ncbi:ATP-binding cassette domain-containing protein [Mycoplasma procyoni]|uniref:ATP-binding cassette domain-containing protein n=1 Tax=Mycoplasma procyoni TaxID=568784 RepID=UPI00197B1C0D|nr:ABC transporter ATP-binding protein [Mycoplasma procyoni]MBN3534546.1 ABC transporter ATP-binding protein [Mycoplasma procyoni]
MEKENIVQIKNLEFFYDKKQTLKIEELNFSENEIISIVGPSGSGKSTLLNIISKLLKPTKGEVFIKNNLKIHEIGYILQNHFLYDEISVFDNIFLSSKSSFKWKKESFLEAIKNFSDQDSKLASLVAKYQSNIQENREFWLRNLIRIKGLFTKKETKNKDFLKQTKLKNIFRIQLEELAQKLEISDLLNKKAKELSGGQKQRVAFAKAIIKKNNLILMDEPFSALDIKIKEKSIQWLTETKKQFNLSIIMVTHEQNDALKISDKILLLNQGTVEQFDDPVTIFEKPKSLFCANFFGYPEINFLKKEQDKDFYIRANKIELLPNQEGEFILENKEYTGNLVIYFLKNKEQTIKVSLLKDLYEINDKFDLKYNQKDLISF